MFCLFVPGESEEDLVLQSEASYFLRFPIKELPLQKKNAKGVLSMKLGKGDRIRSALLIAPGSERLSTEKGELMLSRLKQSHRGGRGTKH
ncbi:MAG: DNA gyrase C-terminal beta-propeller domain-containing protein [Oribacterium sp.]